MPSPRRGIRVRRFHPSSSATGIVADTTGVVLAIGCRKLVTTYAGSCLRVVRASDSAQQDIGFAPTGELDVASALAFKGASSLKVVTWYDQSGNARDVTQATDANRPALTTSNASYSNKATVDFVTASSTYLQSSAFSSSSEPTAVFASYHNTTTNGIVLDASTATSTRLEIYNAGAGNASVYGGSAGLTWSGSGTGVMVACGLTSATNDEWYVNDKTTARATGSAGVGTIDGLTVGRYFGGGYHATGSIRNIVLHSGTLSTAQRQAIMQALADDIGATV